MIYARIQGRAASRPSPGGALLIGTAILWGSSFPILRYSVGDLSPTVVVAWSSTIGSIGLFAVLLVGRHTVALSYLPSLCFDAFVLAVMLGACNILARLGLKTASASHGAFIINLSVVLVPLLDCLRNRRRPSPRMCVASMSALAGIALIVNSAGEIVGDTWLVLCAIAYSVYIIGFSRLA